MHWFSTSADLATNWGFTGRGPGASPGAFRISGTVGVEPQEPPYTHGLAKSTPTVRAHSSSSMLSYLGCRDKDGKLTARVPLKGHFKATTIWPTHVLMDSGTLVLGVWSLCGDYCSKTPPCIVRRTRVAFWGRTWAPAYLNPY